MLGLGMKMEQSLSPSAHLQHPMGAEAPVVGNSWRTLASGEALELGGTGRTPWPQGCGGSLWVSLRIRGDVDQWGLSVLHTDQQQGGLGASDCANSWALFMFSGINSSAGHNSWNSPD